MLFGAAREKAGLFDVSHMGEFVIRGKDALANLQRIFTNDFTNMTKGRVRYTPMCNESGGIIDDMVVCKMEEERRLRGHFRNLRPDRPSRKTLAALEKRAILGGYPLSNKRILWCVTKVNTKEEIDELVEVLKESAL